MNPESNGDITHDAAVNRKVSEMELKIDGFPEGMSKILKKKVGFQGKEDQTKKGV